MLTPQQIEEARKSLGINTTNPATPTASNLIERLNQTENKPSFGGQLVRDIVKPFAKLATSGVNIAQGIIGAKETQPFSGSYLGDVKKVGDGFDITKGFTKENISALKDSIRTGVDLGLTTAGGGGTVNLAKLGLKEGIKQSAIQGAKLGSTIGGIGGASTGLDDEATIGSTLKNTAVGIVAGGATGGVLGGSIPATGAVVKGVSKVVGSGVKGVGKIAESKIPKILSIFTGESNDVVTSALKNPRIADLGIKGGDEALRSAVQKGSYSSIKARTDFSKAYNDAFASLAQRNPNKLVSRQRILYNFVDDLEKAGVSVKNGKPDFTVSMIGVNPGEATKIKNAYEALQAWDDWSLEGANLFKQLIGKLTKFPTETGGTSKSPFLGKFYNFVDNEIKNNLSKTDAKIYSEMNKKFSSSIDLYDDMVAAFNSGDPFTKIAQVFGKNKDTLRQVIDFYEKTTGNQIKPIVAGRQLAEERPAAFGFLNPRQWIDFFISPETQAGIVTKVGKSRQSLVKNPIKIKASVGTKILNTQNPKINNSNVISPKSTIKATKSKASLKGKGEIPTKLNSLETEARKYKSAEEFVKAQGETLYHGSPNADKIQQLKSSTGQEGYFGNGVYLTRDKNVANSFTKRESMSPNLEPIGNGNFQDINTGEIKKGGKPGIIEATLPKNIKLKRITIDEMDTEIEKFRQPNGVIDLKGARNAIRDKYAKQGYDGFEVPATKYFDEPQTVIFPQSENKILTKSQLTDIWKKANKK